MKYAKFVILFIVFIGLVLYVTKTGAKEYADENSILKNGVVFEGTVIDIKRSNNHSFGILRINVIHSTVKEFSEQPKQGIYPYRIKDKKAEIYLPIYVGRQIGDHVKLISDKQIIDYKGKNTEDQGEVYIITDASDINFVKENTLFKIEKK
ncbi:hypothetical protein ACM46_03185 [Chryseobacterium angstadtii]|uniref:Uncharacterized protein n=1 Tax=Chryseobacterium angstadtii TaxID=558151 RepID=A0A0J7IKC6_9FLAO|nr:hypothetical protein [Chryseobacterium angstadtii]KMQ66547.1 hypothetical protein ACM46_03185 [Chryseobacterium angstadtii]